MSTNPTSRPDQARQFLSEVQVEFKKVTWPSQRETIAGAVSVAILSILIGVILFLVDIGVVGVMAQIWN